MEEGEPVRVATPLSGAFIHNARKAYERCIAERAHGGTLVTDDNNYSRYALDAIILSVAALEALLNEVALSPLALTLRRAEPALESLERLGISDKYLLVPFVLWQTTFDPSIPPFQDFACLVKVRNDLVHYKMPFAVLRQEAKYLKPDYLRALATRRLLIEPPRSTGSLGWPDNLCSAKVALWAHTTACRMAKALMAKADGATRQVYGDLMNNFQEIPEDLWKTILAEPDGTSS